MFTTEYLTVLSVAGYFVGRRLIQRTRLSMPLTFAAWWTCLQYVEYNAGRLATGIPFPWLQLGHAMLPFDRIIQIVDLGGVWLATGLAAFTAASTVEVACTLTTPRSHFYNGLLVRQAAWPLCAVGAAWAYGENRIATTQTVDGPCFCMMSADSAPAVSIESPPASLDGNSDKPASLPSRAGVADAYLWPEIALSATIVDAGVSPSSRASLITEHPEYVFDGSAMQTLARLAVALDGTLFIGATRLTEESARILHYNCLAVVDQKRGWIGAYDKRFPIPWREHNPIAEWTGLSTDQYVRGKSLPLFPCVRRATGESFRCGALVCYDTAFPAATRDYFAAHLDDAPDFFVVASHEGFDDGRRLQRQMKTMARLRAIESRRSLVRNTEGGDSELIDSTGRLLASESSLDSDRLCVFPPVPIDRRRSLYSYAGDWFPWTCALILILSSMPVGRRDPTSTSSHAC
jgi:apolipoprotein N-acyltransferase